MAKRKKIALFMGEIVLDFQKDVCKELMKQSKIKNLDIIHFASFGSYVGPNGRNMFFEMGEKNIIHLPVLSEYDAIIVCPDTFDIYGMDTELYALLKEQTSCPIVSIRAEVPDFPTVTVNNKSATKRITNHFIKDHGFTNICYMSGPLNIKDGAARYSGFCEAMNEAGLPLKANTLFEGDYWREKGVLAVNHFYNCPDEDKPQAIICANDYMALSVIKELLNRGIRIPEDVCVCGFDDTPDSRTSNPPITTIKTNPADFLVKALELIEDMWAGKEVQKVNYINDEILLRESCGCGELKEKVTAIEVLKQMHLYDNLLRATSRISSDYQSSFTLENALTVANYHFQTLDCSTGYLCLCDTNDEEYNSIENHKIFTDKIFLKLITHKDVNKNSITPNTGFERKDILPLQYFEGGPKYFIVFQIHFRTTAYGYLVLEPEEGEWPNIFAINFLNTLAFAIESSIMENEFNELSKIKSQYLIDPLTNVFNRRGFEKNIQTLLTRIDANDNTRLTIVSIDMDNLKQINDQYGHAEGDLAIISVINAIQSCLEGEDFCARIGGDEFIAVLVSNDMNDNYNFKERVLRAIATKSIELSKPYTLHASLGFCGPLKLKEINLYNCMQIADEDMYKNKREYKNSLK